MGDFDAQYAGLHSDHRVSTSKVRVREWKRRPLRSKGSEFEANLKSAPAREPHYSQQTFRVSFPSIPNLCARRFSIGRQRLVRDWPVATGNRSLRFRLHNPGEKAVIGQA